MKILEGKMLVICIEEVPDDDLLPDLFMGQRDQFTAASSVLELRLVLLQQFLQFIVI